MVLIEMWTAPGGKRVDNLTVPEDYVFHGMVVRQHGNQRFRAGGGFGGGADDLRAERPQLLCAASRFVVKRQCMARFDQITGHR